MSAIEDAIWDKVKEQISTGKQTFMGVLSEWLVTPIMIDGVLAFATVTREREFHFVSFGHKKRLSFKMGREWLTPILDRYGSVITKTPKDDLRQRRFNEAVGFVPCGEDGQFVNYVLYGRRECQ